MCTTQLWILQVCVFVMCSGLLSSDGVVHLPKWKARWFPKYLGIKDRLSIHPITMTTALSLPLFFWKSALIVNYFFYHSLQWDSWFLDLPPVFRCYRHVKQTWWKLGPGGQMLHVRLEPLSCQYKLLVVRTSPHSDCIHLDLVVVDSGFYTNVDWKGKGDVMSYTVYTLQKQRLFWLLLEILLPSEQLWSKDIVNKSRQGLRIKKGNSISQVKWINFQ